MLPTKRFVCCSACFEEEGLRYNASLVGSVSDRPCRACRRTDGRKLTRQQLANAAHLFFVRGSFHRTTYGGAPLLQMNDTNDGDDLPGALGRDAEIVRRHTNLRVFHYGPRFWMLGDIEPLKLLRLPGRRHEVIPRILATYPDRVLRKGTRFYRMRLDPAKPEDADQYDAPPRHIAGSGRLCRPGKPVLYSSQDLEICIHETRATVDDALYVATLECERDLRLLDLSALLSEEGTEFDSLDLAVLFVFLAGKHAYDIARSFADAADVVGYDGIVYPSYFSRARSGAETVETVYGLSGRRIEQMREREDAKVIRNLALFGRPLERGDVSVTSINTVRLGHISYGAFLGPTGLGSDP